MQHRGKKEEPAAAKSLLPKLKATTEATFLRAAQSNDAAGSLTLPPQTKEAVDKATKLQEDISKLEGVEGAEEVLEAKKKALKLLQPKLPQSSQHLKDHGDLVNALRELEEKASSKEQEFKGKLRKLMDDDLRIIAEAKKAVQQIAERAAQQTKDVETSQEQRTEAIQEAIREVRKEIEDLKKEVDEKERILREKAGPLATALAAGDAAVTFLPVVAGNVVHSNDVTPEAMKQAALVDPMLASFGGGHGRAGGSVSPILADILPIKVANGSSKSGTDGSNCGTTAAAQQRGGPRGEGEGTGDGGRRSPHGPVRHGSGDRPSQRQGGRCLRRKEDPKEGEEKDGCLEKEEWRDCGRFGFMGGTCDSVRRGLKFTQPRSKTTGSHFSGDNNATCNGTRTRVAPLQCTLPSSRAAAAVARWSRSSFTFGSTINSFTTPTFLLKSANLYNVLPVSNHL